MLTFLAVVHILIGLALVLFVLLQDPKGGAMGAFTASSSSQSFFGASGASNFLTTTTRWLAILFAVSCLVLTYLTTKGRGGSVMDSYSPPPMAPSAPAAEGAAPSTPAASDATVPAPATPPAPTEAPKK